MNKVILLLLLLLAWSSSDAQIMRRRVRIAGGGSRTTVVDTVTAANHDAMSDPGDENLVYPTTVYTVLAGTGYDPGPAQVGFMVVSSVPQGVTLDTAIAQLYFNTEAHDADTVGIFAYNVDNVAVFDGAHTHELVAHATLTTDSVVWALYPNGTDTTVNTPNLAALLQTVINRAGYASGNRIGIVMRGWLDKWTNGEYQTIYNFESGVQARKARFRWVYH